MGKCRSHSLDMFVRSRGKKEGGGDISNALNRPLVAPLLNSHKEAIGRKCRGGSRESQLTPYPSLLLLLLRVSAVSDPTGFTRESEGNMCDVCNKKVLGIVPTNLHHFVWLNYLSDTIYNLT